MTAEISKTSKIYIEYKKNGTAPNHYNLDEEIEFLEEYIAKQNHELTFILHILKTLPLNKKIILICIAILGKKNTHNYSLFRIEIISILNGYKKYVPISKFIIEILVLSIEKNTGAKDTGKYGLKVGSNKIGNKDYNEKVFKKGSRLLYKHLDKYSNCIGFPELVYFVIKKIDEYDELQELAVKLTKHSQYIENERKGVKKLDLSSNTKKMSDR